MPRADESDPPRTDPTPQAAASGSAERTPITAGSTVSTDRPVVPSASSDTLMSAPQATRADLALDERLAVVERNVRELSARLAELSEQKVEDAASAGKFRWFWLVFLAGLAVAWQILAHLR